MVGNGTVTCLAVAAVETFVYDDSTPLLLVEAQTPIAFFAWNINLTRSRFCSEAALGSLKAESGHCVAHHSFVFFAHHISIY
jgi:hypothetical protein